MSEQTLTGNAPIASAERILLHAPQSKQTIEDHTTPDADVEDASLEAWRDERK